QEQRPDEGEIATGILLRDVPDLALDTLDDALEQILSARQRRLGRQSARHEPGSPNQERHDRPREYECGIDLEGARLPVDDRIRGDVHDYALSSRAGAPGSERNRETRSRRTMMKPTRQTNARSQRLPITK